MRKLKQIIAIIFIIPLSLYSQVDTLTEFAIGENYGGGIIFYVNQSGIHGLIAAPYDQTTKKVSWGDKGITNALSPDDGQVNQKKILEFHKRVNTYNDETTSSYCAVRFCDTLSIGGFTDWYLPAIDELRVMYEYRSTIGNFLAGDYCSSTEYGKKDAYSIHFRPCKRIDFYYNKVDKDYFVRCIRKF